MINLKAVKNSPNNSFVSLRIMRLNVINKEVADSRKQQKIETHYFP